MAGSDDDWVSEADTWSASARAAGIGPDGEPDPDAQMGIESVLGFQLPAAVERPRRSRVNIATAGLAALVVAAGAFYAGVRVEKSHAKSSSTGSLAAAFGRFAGRTGGTGTGSGRGAGTGAGALTGAGVTVGQVKLVDGKNVYVTDTSGGITKIVTNSTSTISVSTEGLVSDVKPGDTVIVRGAAAKDGTVTATSITDSGAGAAGFGGGRAGG